MKHYYYKYENGNYVKKLVRRERGLKPYAIGITAIAALLVIVLVTLAIANQKSAVLSADGPGDTYYYNISNEDKIIIAKTVFAEAGGECYEGKVAVAAVVLNRYRFDENPYDFDNDSISSVILQKNQFASIEDVTMQDLEENPDCMLAVEDACKGWDPTRKMFSDGALYFYAPAGVSGYQAEIREGIRVLVIGNHNFHYDFEKVAVG